MLLFIGLFNLLNVARTCIVLLYIQESGHYDEMFASEFEQFLSRKLNTEEDDYMSYIEDHLQKNQCPLFCARLW